MIARLDADVLVLGDVDWDAGGAAAAALRDRLAALGCNAFQGWLYSPAVPGDEAIALLPKIDPATSTTNA